MMKAFGNNIAMSLNDAFIPLLFMKTILMLE